MPTTHTYTVYCKVPGDGRRIYAEEVDVRIGTKSSAAALRAAQRILDTEPAYAGAALRAVRAVYRPAGYWWL